MGLVRGIEQEKPETIIRVHNLNFAQIVVPLQPQGIELHVRVDALRLRGSGERRAGDVRLKAGFSFLGGDGDSEE